MLITYNPADDLANLIRRMPATPYSVTIRTTVGKSFSGEIGITQTANGVVQIQVKRPGIAGQDRIDYVYEFKGDVMTGTDRLAHELIRRRIRPGATWDQRLVDILGGAREPALLVLDRAYGQTQMKIAAGQGTWTKSNESGQVALRNSLGRVFLAAKSGALVGITAGRGDQALRYNYVWQPTAKLISPLADSTYITVSSFLQKSALPKSDAATEESIRSVIRAHQRFAVGTVTVDGVKILLNRNRIGEVRANSRWQFDGTKLSVRGANGTYTYLKPRRRDEVLPTLAKLGVTVDPYSRNLLNRQIPFRDLLRGLDRMRTVGQIGSGSSQLTIVEATGPGRKLAFTIRPDGLVHESDYDISGKSGQIQSVRKFQYSRTAPNIAN
jgi:hypothetical protein